MVTAGAVAIGATVAVSADQVMIQQTPSPLGFEQTVAAIEHTVIVSLSARRWRGGDCAHELRADEQPVQDQY